MMKKLLVVLFVLAMALPAQAETIDNFADVTANITATTRVPVQDPNNPSHTEASTVQGVVNKGLEAHDFAPGSHVSDTSNPHQVTPAQIGAATEAALDAHETDTGNPHNVTAAQAGAAPAAAAVPAGGTTGQVLKKNSDTDYDTGWADETGGGGGSPGGEQNSVQYNDGAGGFAGNANFKYDPATDALNVGSVHSNAADGEHYIAPVNTTDKTSPTEGMMWYNTTDKTYRYWDGTQNVDVPGAGGGGGVEGVTGTAPITVDNTDPANPVIGIDGSGYAPASHVSDTTVHVPAGGTTGQVLEKASNADGDTHWQDLPAGGGGVEGVTGTAPVIVDNTDPANPIVEFDTSVYTPASHATQTDNPHSVTASQVGAPASSQVGNIIISADCASETGVQYDLCFQTN